MTTIISFDPGQTTGVCWAEVDLDRHQIMDFETTTLKWDNRFEVHGLLSKLRPKWIVVEDFKLYARYAKHQINNDFPSAKVIGLIEAYAYQLGLLHVIKFHMASEISRVELPGEVAKYMRGTTPHEKDAYRHLRLFVLSFTGK